MAREHVTPQRTPEQKGIVQTLSNAAPPTVEFQHDVGSDPNGLPREAIQAVQVAPVIGDATQRNRRRDEEMTDEERPREPKRFQVLETRHVLDPVSNTRVRLPAGKEISEQQYDIRALQRQGVKLRDISNLDPHSPLPTY